MSEYKHYPTVDGLRGLAIIMVMLVHFTLNFGVDVPILRRVFSVGSTGVDLFFVISGFLISTILLESKDKKNYFKNFYARRILRIFPLYYGFLILFIFVVPFILNHEVSNLQRNQIWYWLYIPNFFFSEHPTQVTFFHLWSLAVEEQFYLVWPIIILFFNNRTLKFLCLGMLIGSFLFRTYFVFVDPHNDIFIWSFTFCRLEPLAVGAFISVLLRSEINLDKLANISSKVFLIIFFGISLIFITRQGFFWNDPIVQSFGLLLIAILYGSLLILCITRYSKRLTAFFSSRILIEVGKYSYSLYLFHEYITEKLVVPFIKQIQIYLSPFPTLIILYFFGFFLSYLASLASWNLYEKHFIRLKKYFPKPK